MEPNTSVSNVEAARAERRQLEALRESVMGESSSWNAPGEESMEMSQPSSAQTAYPIMGPEDAPRQISPYQPHSVVEVTWVEADTSIPLKVWYVETTTFQGCYGMDGTMMSVTRRQLRSREITEDMVRQNRTQAISTSRCVQRAITTQLRNAARQNHLPTLHEWREWLHPFSRKIVAEFQCSECHQIRKTFSRFGT